MKTKNKYKSFVKISTVASRGQTNWTNTIALLGLVDNYCEVFLGILSILAVGGISVYLSGENFDHPLYVLRANSLERGHFKISLVREIFCSLSSAVPTVCTTPPIPPRGRLSISVTIIFDHFYYINHHNIESIIIIITIMINCDTNNTIIDHNSLIVTIIFEHRNNHNIIVHINTMIIDHHENHLINVCSTPYQLTFIINSLISLILSLILIFINYLSLHYHLMMRW